MANKYMTTCSISSLIREMQNKAIIWLEDMKKILHFQVPSKIYGNSWPLLGRVKLVKITSEDNLALS